MKNSKKWTKTQKVCLGSSGIGGVFTVIAIFTVGTSFSMFFVATAICFGMIPLFVTLTMTTLESLDRAIYMEARKSMKRREQQKMETRREADRDEEKLNQELADLDRILKSQHLQMSK